MLNQTVLVGRLTKITKLEKDEKGRDIANITLSVPKNYKNENGEYDTDFVSCELLNGIAKNTIEYCKIGDLVGIKGSIKSDDKGIKICAEKVTFLTSKKYENEEMDR